MTDVNSSLIVHQLLYYALLDMRFEAHETGSKSIYHLADLFHNLSMEMEAASQQNSPESYDEVLESLKQAASRKGVEQWIEERIVHIESLFRNEKPTG